MRQENRLTRYPAEKHVIQSDPHLLFTVSHPALIYCVGQGGGQSTDLLTGWSVMDRANSSDFTWMPTKVFWVLGRRWCERQEYEPNGNEGPSRHGRLRATDRRQEKGLRAHGSAVPNLRAATSSCGALCLSTTSWE
jgi:hypothetical protein